MSQGKHKCFSILSNFCFKMEIINERRETNLNKWMEQAKDTHGVTHPHSLKYSNVNPKVETTEGVGVCSLIRNTLKVKRRVGAPGWWTKTSDKRVNYSCEPTQTK
jgi:hypothetical protein